VTPAVFQYIVVVIVVILIAIPIGILIAGVILIAGAILIAGVIAVVGVVVVVGVIVVIVEVDDGRATDELLGSGWERPAVKPPSRTVGTSDFGVGALAQANQLPLQGRLVLRWGATWEVRLLYIFALFCTSNGPFFKSFCFFVLWPVGGAALSQSQCRLLFVVLWLQW
jgi:hypothetical protein